MSDAAVDDWRGPTFVSPRFEQRRALVVGIDHYRHGIQPLENAGRDAAQVAAMLRERHGYTVELLRDDAATREAIEAAFAALHGAGPDGLVLVYFAGHGLAHTDHGGQLDGYLLPFDARRDAPETWLEMKALRAWVEGLSCHHGLVVLDCCFAGVLARATHRMLTTAGALEQERYLHFLKRPAFQLLVSAAHDEAALDNLSTRPTGGHSPFARALLDGVGHGRADTNDDRVITATELYLYVRERLAAEPSARQTPGLWPLARHEGGEFVFLTGEPSLPEAVALSAATNPYRGLEPFAPSDASRFFGRDGTLEQLGERMAERPLVTVSGPSGIGKTSVLQAGLTGVSGQDVLRVVRPAGAPWSALIEAVEDLPDMPPGARLVLVIDPLEELLTMNPAQRERAAMLDLCRALFEWARAGDRAALGRLGDRERRLRPLLDLGDRLRVVLSMRSDFEAWFAEEIAGVDEAARAAWFGLRVFVRPMNREELRACIVRPAAEKVLFYDAAPRDGRTLVDMLLDEVEQMPAALPLLSDALSEIYVAYLESGRGDRTLSWAEFDRVGGVTGALRRRAERVVEAEGRGADPTIRRILTRMVSLNGGERTRRRVARAELWFDDPGEDPRVQRLLGRLVQARLVVSNGEVGSAREIRAETDGPALDWHTWFEPAHDVLVRGWPRLQRWLDDPEALLVGRRLTAAANTWWAQGRRRAHLWADERLSALKPFTAEGDAGRSLALNGIEARFVARSTTARRRWWMVVIGAVATALVGLSTATLVALDNADEARQNAVTAERNADEARRNEAEAKAQTERAEGAEAESRAALRDALVERGRQALVAGSAAIALEPLQKALELSDEASPPTVAHRFLLRRALDARQARAGVFAAQPASRAVETAVAFRPGRSQVAVGGRDGFAVWDLTTRRHAAAPAPIETDGVYQLRYDPDGERLVVVGADRAWVLSGDGGTLLRTLDTTDFEWDRGEDGYASDRVAFDGPRITLTHSRWFISSKSRWATFDQHDGAPLGPVTRRDGYVRALDPRGRRLLLSAGGYDAPDARAAVIDLGSGRATAVDPDGPPRLQAVSGHYGRWVALIARHAVRFWDHDAQRIGSVFEIDDPTSVHFSPDGRSAAIIADDAVHTVDIADPSGASVVRGRPEGIDDLAFSPDGGLMVTWGSRAEARLWSGAAGLAWLDGHVGPVRFARFSPDGAWLATVDAQRVHIWDLAHPHFPLRMRALGHVAERHYGDRVPAAAAVFEPERGTVRFAAHDMGKHLLWDRWDLNTGLLIGSHLPLEGGSLDAPRREPGCSPEVDLFVRARRAGHGELAAADPSDRRIVRIWDLDRCVTLRRMMAHVGPVKALTYLGPHGLLFSYSARDGGRIADATVGGAPLMTLTPGAVGWAGGPAGGERLVVAYDWTSADVWSTDARLPDDTDRAIAGRCRLTEGRFCGPLPAVHERRRSAIRGSTHLAAGLLARTHGLEDEALRRFDAARSAFESLDHAEGHAMAALASGRALPEMPAIGERPVAAAWLRIFAFAFDHLGDLEASQAAIDAAARSMPTLSEVVIRRAMLGFARRPVGQWATVLDEAGVPDEFDARWQLLRWIVAAMRDGPQAASRKEGTFITMVYCEQMPIGAGLRALRRSLAEREPAGAAAGRLQAVRRVLASLDGARPHRAVFRRQLGLPADTRCAGP